VDPASNKKMKKDWKIITEYPVKQYECGLVAGQKVKLLKELKTRDHEKKVKSVNKAGEIWEVLAGADESPRVVWLRQPDGQRHTWDDSSSIFEFFEPI
jgi:hypothetical protein